VSEPFYQWSSDDDLDRDTLAVVICALLDDREAAQTIFESVSKEMLIALTWSVTSWYARALKLNVDGIDVVEVP
jgi:hypothetical protein